MDYNFSILKLDTLIYFYNSCLMYKALDLIKGYNNQ